MLLPTIGEAISFLLAFCNLQLTKRIAKQKFKSKSWPKCNLWFVFVGVLLEL